MRSLSFLFGCAVILAAGPGRAAEPPIGEWLVKDGYAQVRIENCGGALWGVISWEAKPGARDAENPDPALRGRPVLGMPILLDMREKTVNNWGTKEQRWVGHVYNSENGKTYDGSITLTSRNVLRVKGCVLGFLCGGQNWTRVTPEQSAGSDPGSSQSAESAPQTSEEFCANIARRTQN